MRSNWKIVALTEICRPRQWPNITKSRLIAEGYPVYGAAGPIGFHATFTHSKPVLTIACRGTTCGTVTIVPAYSCITGNTMALEDLDEGRVRLEYLAHFLRYRDQSDVISGSAQPQITKQSLSRVRVPLPPLEQQDELVGMMHSVEQCEQSTRRFSAHLQSVKKSASVYLFARGIPGLHRHFKESDAGTIPAAWSVAKLGERARVDTGHSFRSEEFCEAGPERVPVVRIGDLRGGRIRLESAVYVARPEAPDLMRFALQPGDILVGLSGSVGHVARVRPADVPAYLNQRVGRIRLYSGDPRFLEHWYRAPFVQELVRRLSAGAVQCNLSPVQVRELPVPVATPEEEQRIADFFDCIDERLAIEERARDTLTALKTNLSAQFFARGPALE